MTKCGLRVILEHLSSPQVFSRVLVGDGLSLAFLCSVL
jgi:hypothetical protein